VHVWHIDQCQHVDGWPAKEMGADNGWPCHAVMQTVICPYLVLASSQWRDFVWVGCGWCMLFLA
jgi:hypothetical protein